MSLSINSTSFASQAEIPQEYTCGGLDVSPPLWWIGVPAAAKSLV